MHDANFMTTTILTQILTAIKHLETDEETPAVDCLAQKLARTLGEVTWLKENGMFTASFTKLREFLSNVQPVLTSALCALPHDAVPFSNLPSLAVLLNQALFGDHCSREPQECLLLALGFGLQLLVPMLAQRNGAVKIPKKRGAKESTVDESQQTRKKKYTASPAFQHCHFTEELETQWQPFLDTFALFDRSGDGLIKSGHLGQLLWGMGLHTSKEQVLSYVDAIDFSQTGWLTFIECLCVAAREVHATPWENDFLTAAQGVGLGPIACDAVVSASKYLALSYSSSELDTFLSAADSDHDSYLSLDELAQALLSLPFRQRNLDETKQFVHSYPLLSAQRDGANPLIPTTVVSSVYFVELVSHAAQFVNQFPGINLKQTNEQQFEQALAAVTVHQTNSRHEADLAGEAARRTWAKVARKLIPKRSISSGMSSFTSIRYRDLFIGRCMTKWNGATPGINQDALIGRNRNMVVQFLSVLADSGFANQVVLKADGFLVTCGDEKQDPLVFCCCNQCAHVKEAVRPEPRHRVEQKTSSFFSLLNDDVFKLSEGAPPRSIVSLFRKTDETEAVSYSRPASVRIPSRHPISGDHGPLLTMMRLLLMIRFGFFMTLKRCQDLELFARAARVAEVARTLEDACRAGTKNTVPLIANRFLDGGIVC